MQLLRRQPGSAASALSRCRRDLERAGVISREDPEAALQVEGEGFACALLPHPEQRGAFRVWIAHVTLLEASDELAARMGAERSEGGPDPSLLRFASHRTVARGQREGISGSAALLLQRPVRMRSARLSTILWNFARSAVAARIADPHGYSYSSRSLSSVRPPQPRNAVLHSRHRRGASGSQTFWKASSSCGGRSDSRFHQHRPEYSPKRRRPPPPRIA